MVTGIFQKEHTSNVNARHLLDNLASSYSYAVEEAVVTEILANALDAGCRTIKIDVRSGTDMLEIEDDGRGMTAEDFERYHDLAESTKERGRGIGFAGMGAKLAHKVARKVVTQTRSDSFRGASEWGFKQDELRWRYVRARTLAGAGTKVGLTLDADHRGMLDAEFIGATIMRHYGALLDPFLAEMYIWESIYPNGVSITVNGTPLPQQPVIAPALAGQRKEVDVLGRSRRRQGRAVFLYSDEPLPESAQGITISTYGKAVKKENVQVRARDPERVAGWFESPDLVECLTLNKQDFQSAGRLGGGNTRKSEGASWRSSPNGLTRSARVGPRALDSGRLVSWNGRQLPSSVVCRSCATSSGPGDELRCPRPLPTVKLRQRWLTFPGRLTAERRAPPEARENPPHQKPKTG